MVNVTKPEPKLQPIYEVIKREDMVAAFRDALAIANTEVLERVENLVSLYAATQPPALWVWDFSSRWDFDMWW